MNNQPIRVFATIGPNSLSKKVLNAFKSREVDYIRVNLSHTAINDIEPTLEKMLKAGIIVVIDTEGSQVRTGDLGRVWSYKEGNKIRIHNTPIKASSKQLYVRPKEFLDLVGPGTLISIDFDSVLLKVNNVSNLKAQGYVEATVLVGGTVGNNKGVHSDSITKLPALSQKDLVAIEIAKKHHIKYFTLSFIDNADQVIQFKKLYPEAIAYSKVETKKGVINFEKILKVSDGILIDRGDLSREVPVERIPLLQKAIIKKSRELKKPVFIATNILDNMHDHPKPLRSEVNDIVNSLLDGVGGFVLTKETAVGKYPIETINMLKGIINQISSVSNSQMNNLLEISEDKISGNLIEPHGGMLINRYQVMEFNDKDLKRFKKLYIDEEILMDSELISFGVYSPLEGFMNEKEINSVLDKMRLPSGLPWTLPIILTANKKELKGIKNKEVITLVRKQDREIYATLTVDEIKKLDKTLVCKKLFGTDDKNHPGVARIFTGGDYIVAGQINLLKIKPSPFKEYELKPVQTRQIFSEKGWAKIAGFHTRNPIHRSHEFIQLQALRNIPADGLFIHPVVGKKKKGDFEAAVIIRVYELMMKKFYPRNKVVFAVYPTYSRYAGPREAVFTAICRKNYGCSHFIVGRDHTGVGNYYPPNASQEIFKKFPDLGIAPVFFNNVYFSKKLNKYVSENSLKDTLGEVSQVSGTEIREIFKKGKKPPKWLMRPQIAEEIHKLDKELKRNKRSIFVQ